MILVRELMTPSPWCVSLRSSRDLALRSLLDRHLHGAPVVDGDGRLRGVISTHDLSRSLLDGGDGAIEDLMTHPAVTVDGSATLLEAARVMVRRDIHRLIVVEEDGRPAGVLTPLDILTAIVNLEEGFRIRVPDPGPS
jgi:CBS domain-containing protein